MRAFKDINPFVLFLYFVLVSAFPMFCQNGYIYVISLISSLAYFIVKNGSREKKTHGFYFLLFLSFVIINPIVSHNGETVLFVVNNAPITLEAVIYGVYSAVLVVSILYWFRIFSQMMTTDKLLYIFDRFSPKLALVVSMGMRYIPLFKRQIKKIKQGQMILGKYKDDNVVDRFKVGIKIFSSMVTWVLENGIITAESMDARGYGVGKRTRYSNYYFLPFDFVFAFVSITFSALAFFFLKNAEFVFYPKLIINNPKGTELGYAFYIALTLLPIIMEVKETLKWKYLKQKI